MSGEHVELAVVSGWKLSRDPSKREMTFGDALEWLGREFRLRIKMQV